MSEAQPLQVRFRNGSQVATGSDRDSLIAESCKHIIRWQSVVMDVKPTLFPLQLLQSPAPILETANVRVNPRGLEVIDLFGGRAEHLQSLRLSGLAVPWNSSIFSGLRSLEIRRILRAHTPALSELVQIVAGNPRLECLILGPMGHVRHDNVSGIVAVLPVLHTLQLRDLSMNVTTHLLSLIRAPCTRSFVVTCESEGLALSPLTTAIFPFFPMNLSPHQPYLSFDLDSGANCITVETNAVNPDLQDEPRFDVRIGTRSPADFLTAFAGMSGPALHDLPSHVKFCAGFPFESDPTVTILESFHNVVQMKLCSTIGQSFMVEYLTHSQVLGGQRRWAFPKLRKLDIELDAIHLTPVLKMVQSRYQVTSETSSAANTIYPATFEELHVVQSIRSPENGDVDMIRKIIEGAHGTFTWQEEDERQMDWTSFGEGQTDLLEVENLVAIFG